MRLMNQADLKRLGCMECADAYVGYLGNEEKNRGRPKLYAHCHCPYEDCPYQELAQIKADFIKEFDKVVERAFKAGLKRLEMNERRDDGINREELFFHIERDRRVDEDGEEERIDLFELGLGLGRVEEDTPGRNIHDL